MDRHLLFFNILYILLKALEDNSFYLFYKLNQSMVLIDKYMDFFWCFIIVKVCVDFTVLKFYFSF